MNAGKDQHENGTFQEGDLNGRPILRGFARGIAADGVVSPEERKAFHDSARLQSANEATAKRILDEEITRVGARNLGPGRRAAYYVLYIAFPVLVFLAGAAWVTGWFQGTAENERPAASSDGEDERAQARRSELERKDREHQSAEYQERARQAGADDDWTAALAAYDAALLLTPDDSALQAARDRVKREVQARKDRERLSAEHLTLARQAEAAGDWTAALAEYDQALRMAPGDGVLLSLRGRAAARKEQHERDRAQGRLLPLPMGLHEIGRNTQGLWEYENKLDGSVLVSIPGGSFIMGSPDGQGDPDERPAHEVALSAFLLGKREVTVAQFRTFVEATSHRTSAESDGGGFRWDGSRWVRDPALNWRNPGFAQDDHHPVVLVSWHDARAYSDWAGLAIPTEAQWEFAARAGARQFQYGTADGGIGRGLARYHGTRGRDADAGTSLAGSFPANPFGLFDLAGNVWEWCADRYDDGFYSRSPERDPVNNPQDVQSDLCVLRGGSWNNQPLDLRAAVRLGEVPANGVVNTGFRLSFVPRPGVLQDIGENRAR